MRLDKWFAERSKAMFSRRIGVSPATLSEYLAALKENGTRGRLPGLTMRIAIETETGGAVHRERDWPDGREAED